MRKAIFIIALGLTAPMMAATTASATAHDCQQLRNTVRNSVPGDVRNLPYHAINCNVVGEIHLLATANGHRHSWLSDRIEAIFRREGLLR